MPTPKHRLAIIVNPAADEALSDLSDAIDKPKSRIVTELLDELAPNLIDLAKFARHAKAGKKGAAKRALQHMLGNAMAEQLELMKAGK